MESIETLPRTTFSGRRFTRKQLAKVQETVQTFNKLSRKELAHTLCEHLDWKNPRGANKILSCLTMLEELQAYGVITLPAKRHSRTSTPRIEKLAPSEQGPPINDTLSALSPIVLQPVTTPEERTLWKAYLQTHHYLGYKHPVGAHLGYFLVSQPRQQKVGCLLFSASAAWHLAPRDHWIGWDKKHRIKLLHLILSNDRFLIFPWVAVPNLATHALSLATQHVADDWLRVHGYRPVLIETFVDSTRFSGTCYQAANWHCVGQTQGRGRFDPHHKHPETVKQIFVQPLDKNWRARLTEGSQACAQKKRYRNDLSMSRQRTVDPTFVALCKKVVYLFHEVALEYDKQWRVRERIIDTLMLMLLIFRLVTSKHAQGYGTVIDELWDSSESLGLPLPQKNSIAPSSFCAARIKLHEDVFKNLNTKILQAYAPLEASRATWLGHRLFAVDGSKLNLPRPLLNNGYALPASQAHYPQGLLSCLYQLKSQLPLDFNLVTHGNERWCATEHLKVLSPNDVVVYDRGYFSYLLLHQHCEAGIHAIFRLSESSGSVIKDFMAGDATDVLATLVPSDKTRSELQKEHPEITLVPRRVRLLKYTIGSSTFYLATTLVAPQQQTYPLSAFADVYHARWGIEELYKTSKRVFAIEDFHAQTERGVKQEVFAHFVLTTLSRLFANEVDEELNTTSARIDTLKASAASRDGLSSLKVNFKNCIHVIQRHLETLLALHAKFQAAVQSAYRWIVGRFQRVRPGRSYERKSMKPESKWRPDKNRKMMKNQQAVKASPLLV